MSGGLLAHEPLVRLGAFAGVLVAMAVWEGLAPRRRRSLARRSRWPHNLGLALVDGLVVRLLFPGAAVGVALLVEGRGLGLLPALGLGGWAGVACAVVLLDLAIYLQHRIFHAVPVLWRLHLVHHADLDLDVTSGVRFHPLEIVVSMGIKLALVAALGAAPLAVLLFEVVLNATAMFNHANARLPAGLDRALRWVVVTPDMHRVHHSLVRAETDSNFGFNLPWWDRMLGTYRAQPGAGHEAMTIGLAGLRDPPGCTRLDALLLMPWTAGRAAATRDRSGAARRRADQRPPPRGG